MNSPLLVTVYTLPNCIQCDRTKKFLRKEKIRFEEIDLSTNQIARVRVKEEWGFDSAPVVETPFDVWTGFDPKKIKETARDFKAPVADGQ